MKAALLFSSRMGVSNVFENTVTGWGMGVVGVVLGNEADCNRCLSGGT